jgi:hypothetical protein
MLNRARQAVFANRKEISNGGFEPSPTFRHPAGWKGLLPSQQRDRP